MHLFNKPIKKLFEKIILVLALIIMFLKAEARAQNLDVDNKVTGFKSYETYATPLQKLMLLKLDEELNSINFSGSDSINFDIGPTGGAILKSTKKSWFMIKELPIGEKLFEIQTVEGKTLYCSTKPQMDLRYCLMDNENDGLFDVQCNALTSVRAAQASFFPEQLKYAIMRITTPCFEFSAIDKPKYSKLSANNFDSVRVSIIAEKLPFGQIRVSWGVPYGRNNFQWGGMVQEVILKDKANYTLNIGGVEAEIDLTKLVGNGRRYEIKMTKYDNSIPFINIDKRMIYSPFMKKSVLH